MAIRSANTSETRLTENLFIISAELRRNHCFISPAFQLDSKPIFFHIHNWLVKICGCFLAKPENRDWQKKLVLKTAEVAKFFAKTIS